ncbi:MAG: hypothetical protein KatS3mg131_0106 [Candidatus Tectimicrobiota bacterium]|nr:MAG: hypothetical protein KatS3mg131_0106 [Candidatus Tectomicrobia bacterium]
MRAKVVCALLLGLSLGLWASAGTADEVARWLEEAHSPELAVRLRALAALGESGDPRAVPPLLAALHDAHPSVRECAVAALQALVRTLRTAYRALAQWLEDLLAALGGRPAPPREPPVRLQRI